MAHIIDPQQRAELLRLLAAEQISGALDTPSAERAARIGSERELNTFDRVGFHIGAFTLVRLLGQEAWRRSISANALTPIFNRLWP
ncbi:MAG: hypothetical protein IPP82_04995 [Xanthomonadales bacterium]|nr:hypothetical protein [Xanthomonadales bacterium]